MVRVPTVTGSADDLGELLKTPGAMAMLRAYAALDRHQQAAFLKLAWALAEQARAQEGET